MLKTIYTLKIKKTDSETHPLSLIVYSHLEGEKFNGFIEDIYPTAPGKGIMKNYVEMLSKNGDEVKIHIDHEEMVMTSRKKTVSSLLEEISFKL
uniref:Uncharacterized protein n=1 Tax=Rhizobium phage LG08 TaxID=3129229 RepID=A0AAU8HXM7_9CAUD